MRVKDLLDLLDSGKKISHAELQRLERRQEKLSNELDSLNSAIWDCYVVSSAGNRVLDKSVVSRGNTGARMDQGDT